MAAIRRILACSDLSEHARTAAGRAAQLARQLGAQLELLHVSASSGGSAHASARAELDALAGQLERDGGVRPAVRVEAGDPVDVIHAAAHGAQLLVVGATSRHALRRLVAGTTADPLVERSLSPVLVVKRPAAQPWRRVLVPVDFSPYAQAALELALAVAPQADVTALHAIEAAPIEAMRAGGPTAQMLAAAGRQVPAQAEQAAQALDALLAQAQASDGRRATALVARGEAVEAILAQATQTGAELIVAGRHGRSKLEALLVGSVTRRLLHEADCDVLVSTGATRVGYDSDALPPRYD